ncbi:protein LEAD-SENSITIVE 1-like [Syzygium oleosum]|uniref:protein LEAD-SENSITIVE 1-like n=1 Tax=Syzygium oleosum TaxID=219896 RepID=UPI0011D28CA4|nr:protein LEAD-SENSITIVE 1-like [Syzygium oleosum]
MAARIISKVFPVVVTEEELEPGDHVYTYRRYGVYTHHGIYIGEGTVIHFTRTGVDATCLDCFRREGEKLHSLRSYAYGRSLLRFMFTKRGTCTTLPDTRLPQEVVNTARELHERGGFGEYDLLNNNCEHFATFCRTGVRESTQTAWISSCERKIEKAKAWALKLLRELSSSDPKIRGELSMGIESKSSIAEQA